MRKRILVVTKDARPAMIASAILPELALLGFDDIKIVAEAASIAIWEKASRQIDYRGPVAYDSTNPWKIDVNDVIFREKPAAVLVGLSSPMNLEAEFLLAATAAGIPTIAIDDAWGSFHRATCVAGLYLTIDDLGKRLILHDEKYGRTKNAPCIIGDTAGTPPTDAARAYVESERKYRGMVVGLATQKWPESIHILEIALPSLVESRKRGVRFVVVPLIHGGASADDKKKWTRIIDAYAPDLRGALTWLQDVPGLKWADNLPQLADVYIAATGTGLRACALAGGIPVCINNDELASMLYKESNMDVHPLVQCGAALNLRAQHDLFELIKLGRDTVRMMQKFFVKHTPFDPKAGALGIAEMLAA